MLNTMPFSRSLFFLLILPLLLLSCASVGERKAKDAEQSYAQGNYDSAFNSGYESLVADAWDDRPIRIFPDLVQQVRRLHHEKIRTNTNRDWDSVALSYARLQEVNERVRTIQQWHQAEQQQGGKRFDRNVSSAELERIAALPIETLEPESTHAHQQAATVHYNKGLHHATQQVYRQAVTEFRTALRFVAGFRDAENKAWRNEQLANKQDAKRAYNQGVKLASQQQYRAAQHAFERVSSFVPGYRDSSALSNRYRNLADHQDAKIRYDQALGYAANSQYRLAAQILTECLTFVPDYKDAVQKKLHFSQKADSKEAGESYEQGLKHMLDQQYKAAERAFTHAHQLVPGFKDASQRAEVARESIPPSKHEIHRAISASLTNAVPLSWVGARHGHTEDVRIHRQNIVWQGPYNSRYHFWLVRVELEGNCELERKNHPDQTLPFAVTATFKVQRQGRAGLHAWLAD